VIVARVGLGRPPDVRADVLRALSDRESATVRDLAAALGRTRQSVYGVLQRMVELGLALRVEHGTYVATARMAPWLRPDRAAYVEAALLRAGAEGYDIDALARALRLPRDSVRLSVSRLVAAGRAERVRAGIWRAA